MKKEGETMEVRQYAENALTIYMGGDIDEEVNRRLVELKKKIESLDITGLGEIVISYTSLIVYFDIFETDAGTVERKIGDIDMEALLEGGFEYRLVEIPVCYGGDMVRVLKILKRTDFLQMELLKSTAGRNSWGKCSGSCPAL